MNYQTISRFMIASSIALGVSLPASANAAGDKNLDCKGSYERHGRHGEFNAASHPIPPYLKKLNLTDEQKGKIESLVQNQAQVMHDKIKVMHEAKMELRHIPMSSEYDEAKVKALSESSAKEMAEIAELHARTDHQIYQLLTPEQRKQMEEQRAKFESKRMAKPDVDIMERH